MVKGGRRDRRPMNNTTTREVKLQKTILSVLKTNKQGFVVVLFWLSSGLGEESGFQGFHRIKSDEEKPLNLARWSDCVWV